jgi:hypothetical protein
MLLNSYLAWQQGLWRVQHHDLAGSVEQQLEHHRMLCARLRSLFPYGTQASELWFASGIFAAIETGECRFRRRPQSRRR